LDLSFVHFNPGVFEQELDDRMVSKEASPVEGSSVVFWIFPADIDSWIIRKVLHKVKVSRGTTAALLRNQTFRESKLKEQKDQESERESIELIKKFEKSKRKGRKEGRRKRKIT